MNKQEAIKLVNEMTVNKNLVKHMLAVGACMRALAEHFEEDGDLWEVAGIVHDADYEQFAKTDPKKHPSVIFEILGKVGADQRIVDAVKAHAWGHSELSKKPENNMEWSIYCCDELTGLITAVALTRPSKKLADVEVKSVRKKWKKKDFAAGVARENIEMCEQELGIPLDEFIGICLQAMQGISGELGL
jgi:putative nucleotidyltransferase with HDIG domain